MFLLLYYLNKGAMNIEKEDLVIYLGRIYLVLKIKANIIFTLLIHTIIKFCYWNHIQVSNQLVLEEK